MAKFQVQNQWGGLIAKEIDSSLSKALLSVPYILSIWSAQYWKKKHADV